MDVLLPHLRGVAVDEVRSVGGAVVIEARSDATASACPECGTRSARVHGRYQRRLVDNASAGLPVTIRLRVRRFRCQEAACSTTTFAEQFDGLTTPHARYTAPARRTLTGIAVALAGRAGARLARLLGLKAARDTLLKLVRSAPEPADGALTVVGVDDFALRRGHVYGTVIVNMETHKPVAVLEGRDAEPLAQWLQEHPGIVVVCRDRAGAYAEGTRIGAPQAIQVADRWHLWHNLGDAVDKTVTAHHSCVRAHVATSTEPRPPEPEPERRENDVAGRAQGFAADATTALDVCGRERVVVSRTRQRHAAIHQLLAEGQSLSGICRVLRLDRSTVRRFAQSDSVEPFLVKALNRTSLVDPYIHHLTTRFDAGVHDATALYTEIRAMGYTGSVQTVRRHLHPLRGTTNGRPRRSTPRPAVAKPREITRWIMTDPNHLDTDDAARLATVLAACPELDATARHVREFADIMRKRRGHRISDWIQSVAADNLPALHSLTTGLRRDLDAVIAGLTMDWNSGPVEGNVNRIKTLKRQMYGRAGFALLRKRILITT